MRIMNRILMFKNRAWLALAVFCISRTKWYSDFLNEDKETTIATIRWFEAYCKPPHNY